MPISLASIAASLGSKKITVRDIEITIRAVTAAEEMAIVAQIPEPKVDLVPGPKRGTLVPNPNNPQNARDQRRHTAILNCMRVAIGADFANVKGEAWTPQRDAAWCGALADEMLAKFTDYELGGLRTEILTLDMGSIKSDEKRIGSEVEAGN